MLGPWKPTRQSVAEKEKAMLGRAAVPQTYVNTGLSIWRCLRSVERIATVESILTSRST